MDNNAGVKVLSTIKKDEAAFYLSELARGLLKNRASLRVGNRDLVLPTLDAIQMEMKTLDKDEQYGVDIRLSWRKPPLDIGFGRANVHPVAGKQDGLI